MSGGDDDVGPELELELELRKGMDGNGWERDTSVLFPASARRMLCYEICMRYDRYECMRYP
jgi:hypothetical protein